MAIYRVLRDGFIAGVFYKSGERIELGAKQAEYLAPPYGVSVEPVSDDPEAVQTAPTAKRGRKGR